MVKLTFYSNFLNHHQLPFCEEMYKVLGDDFKFVATEPIPEERLKMGYHDMSTQYPFALNTYANIEAYETALKLGDESDVVIIGSAPKKFIKERLSMDKLTFYYMERVFKKGRHRIINPKTLANLLLNHTRHRNKNLYMLCASAYTASDFGMVGAYKNKTYKWGYFPQVKKYDLDILLKQKKQNTIPKLLWVGRFLKWKHPDDAIRLAVMLKKDKYEFSLDIIGTGPLESKLKNMIRENDLQNEVNLLGSMKPEEVRVNMENANIFLFTSDFNEGWGAVLNESMNSACAVVASHAIGSVPYLLNHNVNGVIYEYGNNDSFYNKVKLLIDNPEKQKKLGIEAHRTLKNTWNEKVAVDRFLDLVNQLLKSKTLNLYDNGPCSKAEIIENNWILTNTER